MRQSSTACSSRCRPPPRKEAIGKSDSERWELILAPAFYLERLDAYHVQFDPLGFAGHRPEAKGATRRHHGVLVIEPGDEAKGTRRWLEDIQNLDAIHREDR